MLFPPFGFESLPPIPREFRAAWVATVANIDWPSKKTLTADEQKREMIAILEEAKRIHLNAIVFQVRPTADALYPSKLEPWSEYLTGKQGQPPTPNYDPLAFAVTEAHKRGIELHCWFNPYRAKHFEQKGPLAPTHIAVKHPEVVKSYGKYLWMDPGEPLVQKHSLDVIQDVVRRYDIDGVHIDDYFYPYPEGTTPFPDGPSYDKYKARGGTLALDDWRRKNVDDFIHNMYTTVKKTKKWVKVGISPFGIYRPHQPASIKTSFDQYAVLYADARKWLNEGWCDYYSPQLYWSSKTPDQNYGALLDWWISENSKGRHMWPGNYTSRTGPEEAKKFPASEIADQIEITRNKPGSTGNVHFSMAAFMKNWAGVRDAVSTKYRQEAFVPASPWLSSAPVASPKAELSMTTGNRWSMGWSRPRDVKIFAINVKRGTWGHWLESSDQKFTVDLGKADAVAVVAIDRFGNESKPTIFSADKAKR